MSESRFLLLYEIHFVLDVRFLQGHMEIILLLLHSAYIQEDGIVVTLCEIENYKNTGLNNQKSLI